METSSQIWSRCFTRSSRRASTALGPPAAYLVAASVLATLQCAPSPSTAPDPCGLGVVPTAPTHFAATPGGASVTLSWVNAPGSAGVRLLRRVGAPPDSPEDSESVRVYEGPGTGAVDTTLVIDGSYRYSLWSFDACVPRVYSAAPETVRASPFQPGAPPPPTGLALEPGAHRLRLAWANPPGPVYAATIVRRGLNAFPTDVADGEPVFDGPATSCVDSLLSPLQTYYYSLFTRDVYGVVSSSATQGSGTPDWEYHDFVIPNLRIEDRFPTQRCGPGDCDFGDHGPKISMTVVLERFEGTFWIEVTRFKAEDVELPSGDHSCIEKASFETWASNTYQAPVEEGWIFYSYPTLPTTTVDLTYTDVDSTPDTFTLWLFLDSVTIVASTPGWDICGMTEDDTHLHLLETRPTLARFRR